MALAIKTGVNQATELNDAMAKFQAQTGASSGEMNKFKDIARDVWSNNFGGDVSDVADMMGRVKQQMQGISDVDLKNATEDLLTLRDTFGMDEGETLRGAQQLMEQFGITSQEAFDLMATGAQNGLNKSGELGDNISEYSGKFKQAGYSVEEYFQLMQNGIDGGAYNLDKINDAINEVTTRLVDGTIEGALDSFDTKTQDVFKAWQEGRATQKDVVNAIVEDISNTTNEQEKLNKAATAFGTMGEDFNAEFIQSLTTVGDKYKDVQGTMEEVKDVANGGLKNALSGLGRTFLNSFTPIGEAITPILSGIIRLITVAIQGIQRGFAKVGDVISNVLSKIDTSGITKIISQVPEVLAPVFDAIDKIKIALEPIAKDILAKIIEAIQNIVNRAQKILSVVGPPILAIIKMVISNIVGLIPVITSILSIVGSVVSGIISFISTVISYVGSAISTILSIIMPIIQIIASIISNIWSLIVTVATNIWGKISEVVSAIIQFASGLFQSISSIFESIWNVIKGVFDNIGNILQNVIDIIDSSFAGVKDTISNVFGDVWSKVKIVMDKVGNKISNVLHGIQNAWSGLKGFVGGVFNGIEGAVQSLVGSVKGMVNGVIGGINGAISIINKIPGVSIGKIPKLERGGVLKRGQIGLLEGNGAEAVVPLEKNKAWIRAVAKDMVQIMPSVTTNNNGQTINFYNKAQSPDEIARMLRMQARYGYGGVIQ